MSGPATDPTRWARVRALYEAADEAESATAYLDTACVGPDGTPDAALRAEVEALLRAGETADDHFLTPHALDAAALHALIDDTPVADRRLGQLLGPYRLDGVLGGGGMGVVYRAEDTRLGRTVAVKLVRSPLAAPDLVRRFDAERHILARLDHPDIARLYDSGAAPDGTPFLVMECVEAEPITAWVERHGLPVRERVALMERVARAVAFAQQRLVVHRDLKPSNVLVSDGDGGKPVVKLLDFGIARLLDAEGDAMLTRTGPGPLTPAYAAPEQLRGEEATTATDVYALGVLLYEVLAGQRPYQTDGRSPAEVERLVTTMRPAPPSGTADLPPERRRRLRGDLDTIVLKALSKEPERRYAAAADLADDLRRHLDGLPVRARPDSVGYRVGRFVRRHRVGVAATALVAAALVAGLVGTAWQAREAAAARDRAEHEAQVAEEVSQFLQAMLASPDPSREGRDVRVADVLDRAAAQLDTGLTEDPAAAARLRQTLGATYRELGLYDAAEPLMRRALADRRRIAAGPDAETAAVLSDLAYVLRLQGNLAGADSVGREALEQVRALYGEHHVKVATALNDLAATARDRGDLRTAERYMRRTLAVDRVLLPSDSPDLATDYANLASVLADLGRPAEAEPLMRRGLAIDRADAGTERDTDVALDLGALASILTDLERYPEAERLYRRALEIRQDLLGPDHPSTLYTQIGLARVLTGEGRGAEALPMYTQSLAGFRATLGDVHLRVAQALAGRAACHAALGQRAEAVADYAAAEGVWAQASPDHPARADALVAWARLEPGAEAAARLREAVRIRTRALGRDHPRTREAASLLRAH